MRLTRRTCVSIVARIEARATKAAKRGPYKKRIVE